MTARLDWHDLKLFVAVAEAGALTGAAREAGLSTATLGRRMHALEAATGLRLFARGKQGYALTAAGADLLAHARDVDAAMERLELWRVGIDPKPVVKISAGPWISSFLAMNIDRLAGSGDGWGVEFHATSAKVDIAHREADIGIRNRRPDEAWLAGRLLGMVRFASYSAEDAPPCWIGLTGDAAEMPSAHWVEAHQGPHVRLRVTDSRLLLDLAMSGAGSVVLPCFIGDRHRDRLHRRQIVEALDAEKWLITHQDTRFHPAIRATLDRIAALMEEHAAAFSGV